MGCLAEVDLLGVEVEKLLEVVGFGSTFGSLCFRMDRVEDFFTSHCIWLELANMTRLGVVLLGVEGQKLGSLSKKGLKSLERVARKEGLVEEAGEEGMETGA